MISQFLFLFQVRPFVFFVLSFLLKFYLLPFSVLFSLLGLSFSFSFMVDHSDIRHTSPSVAFFFAHLGAFIGFSSGHCPQVGEFDLGDSSLCLVLGDLYPLMCQSLGWFELVRGILRRENMGSEVRSSDLEASLSSSAGTGGFEMDTTVFVPSSSFPSIFASPWSFHALKEECSLKEDTFIRFRERFQFLEEIGACLPRKDKMSCAFAHGEVCFYKVAFLYGLRFLVPLFIMELLHHLNIAPRQLMLNSWRIAISCMVIWTIIADGDMITLTSLCIFTV